MEINFDVDVAIKYLSQDHLPVTVSTNLSTPAGLAGRCDSNGTDGYENFYGNSQFVTGLIIYPVLCVTGILGNSLSLIVLSHKDMATSTNVYLLALGISDSLKLMNDFLYFIMLVISQYNPTAAESMMAYVYPYAHYVFQVAVCVTAWLTVSVSMDRYIAVCYPSLSKTLCTIPKARSVVTSVFIVMILLSIPSGFRYRLQTIHDTVNNVTCMELEVTELGRNKEFMIPYTWIQNFLRGIIPVFILVFLNARIINVLRKERVKGKKFTSRNRITLMLIAMVIVFIVCITPDAIMSTFFGKGYVEEDSLVKGIREITDSLVALNSAINFLLYCILSAQFRNTFMRVFFGRRYVKMRGGSGKKGSRDGISEIKKRSMKNYMRENGSGMGAHFSGRNDRRNSNSQLELSCQDGSDSCENSPRSDVAVNGYSKVSDDTSLVKRISKEENVKVGQTLAKQKSTNDFQLTCTVYTGPTDMVRHPWETKEPKVTVCVCQEVKPEGVQL